MMIEISENIIKNSIVKMLSNKFGNGFTYYDEELKEGFLKPSFHVSKINLTNIKDYTGHSIHFDNNYYRYVIKYFSNEKNNINEDINNRIDALKELFRYLQIINIVDELDEDGEPIKVTYFKPNRVNEITVNITDGVLIFEIEFNLRTAQQFEITKVEENILKDTLK